MGFAVAICMKNKLQMAIGLAAAAAMCGAANPETSLGEAGCEVTAPLLSPAGDGLGAVQLMQTPHGVLITARLKGLKPGTHAMHLHEKAKCKPDFGASGAHFNPTGAQHGYKNPQGFHLGDLPNFTVAASGEANVDVFSPDLRLCGGEHPLLDGDGAALIVHGGADDYFTDPAGGAGERIGCAVLSE